VVDGICGDLSFEEGGSPVEANRVIVGRNPLLIDSYCAALIGYKPEDIGYLSLGLKNGLGEFFSEKTKLIELNADKKPKREQKSQRLSERFRNSDIEEDSACSVCYAALMYALRRTSQPGKICIGQGFRGKSGEGIGIGDCTKGFDKYVKGCPPKAVDVAEFLQT
jgi:hypothetical protein